MKHEYDYLLVGAGLFNAVFAQQAKMHGKRCLVIDKRPHLGGNIYCENIDGITVHKYGHIFSIPATRMYGIMSTLSFLLTDLPSTQSPTTRAGYSIFLLTCIRSIRCGAL